MTDGAKGFLSRWSRLKRSGNQRVHDGAAPQLPEPRDPRDETERALADTPAMRQDRAQDPESADPGDLELPSIESLNEESDYSAFMKEGVPEDLRRLALRKLWHLIPEFPDGLDDYDDDYTIVEMAGEAISGADPVAREPSDPDDEAGTTVAAETTDDGEPVGAEEAQAESEDTSDAVRDTVADTADGEDPKGAPGKA